MRIRFMGYNQCCQLSYNFIIRISDINQRKRRLQWQQVSGDIAFHDWCFLTIWHSGHRALAPWKVQPCCSAQVFACAVDLKTWREPTLNSRLQLSHESMQAVGTCVNMIKVMKMIDVVNSFQPVGRLMSFVFCPHCCCTEGRNPFPRIGPTHRRTPLLSPQ